jgi:enoyl-CoA hydratase/carnithine racemase
VPGSIRAMGFEVMREVTHEQRAAPVLFDERHALDGARVGFARLNSESTLNAISLEMIGLLTQRLHAWAEDPAVALVVLEGAGDKAFCAGADIRRLYKAMQEHRVSARRDEACAYLLELLPRGYRLNYLINNYPKPVLCWGHGIVMGGGLG